MSPTSKKLSHDQDVTTTGETRRAFLKRVAGFGLGASASALLAACGATPPATSAPTAAGELAGAATNAPAAATTGTPAAAATSAPVVAATSGPATQLAPAELTWYYPVFGPVKDQQAVTDAVNAIIQPKINATINLQALDYAPFEERSKLANASGEAFDIIFTAGWVNDYFINSAQGNFLPLDELLPKYAPERFAHLPQVRWDGVRVKGNIYGVPSGVQPPAAWGFRASKALAEKYGLDLNAINTYADLEPFLAKVKAGEPDVTPLYSDDKYGTPIRIRMYDIATQSGAVVVRYDDAALKALNYAATPEFKQAAELAWKWHEAGYTTADPLPVSEAQAGIKAGKYAVDLDQYYNEGSGYGFKTKYGYDIVGKPFQPRFLSTGDIVATMQAISRTSKNPERAMMFLEMIYTDPMLNHTLANGVEGKHWEWKDKAARVFGRPAGVTAETTGYNPGIAWLFGDTSQPFYNAEDPRTPAEQDQFLQADQQDALKAEGSTILGFSFDPEPAKTELTQVNTVLGEYVNGLLSGYRNPETDLPEFLDKLNAAGIDAVVAEAQRQLDAWKAAKA